MKRIVLGVVLAIAIPAVALCGALELSEVLEIQVLDDQMARAATLTDDGYYIVAGDGSNRSEAVLVKAMVGGTMGVVWERVYSDTFARMFSSVIELEDGGVVAGGSAFYSIYAGDENAWLVKVDRQGDTLWEKQYGRTSEQNDVYAMAATSDGGFIVCALKLPHYGGDAATWVLKLDVDGNQLWEQTYTSGVGLSILQTSDGGYLITGRQDIAQSLYSHVWALRLDAQGNAVWEQVYTDLEIYVQLSNQVASAPNGDFVIAGKEFVLRIDPSGQVVWNRAFSNRLFNTVAFTDDGKLAVGGAYNDDFFIDHPYMALLSDDALTVIWEDIGLLSGWTAQVIPDPYQGVVVAATVDLGWPNSEIILARFWE